MPEVSRFYGIIIKMYFNDHSPPHFHAFYGDHEVLINISTLAVIAGKVPPRAMGLVTEWAALHQGELLATWGRAREAEPLGKIAPLP